METNIIKRVCKEHGLTYAQLGELIGYSESTINKVASTGEISEPLQKAIELYMKTVEQGRELKKFDDFKKFMKEIIAPEG